MGLPVHGQGSGEVQEDQQLDWYPLYCQAIAAGIDPKDFGGMTYSEIHAAIDGHKLRRLNDMQFNVAEIVSNMDDEGVRKALFGGSSGGAARQKLIEKMLRPYLPSFMLPEVAQAEAAKPIEGLSPKAAEGIMQAVERDIVPHMQWLAIHPVWQRVLATSRLYRPGR